MLYTKFQLNTTSGSGVGQKKIFKMAAMEAILDTELAWFVKFKVY